MNAQVLKPIETERLILRLPTPDDVPELNAAVRETFDDLHRTVEWARDVPEIETTAKVVEFIISSSASGRDYPYYAFLKASNVFVAGLHLFAADLEVPKYEIGYWGRKRFHSQGYVTEAATALTHFGMESLNARRLQILCDVENTASMRVAKKCGYRLEATLENDKLTPEGRLRTTAIHVMLPRDYTQLTLDTNQSLRSTSWQL